ncbi:hypothetical protein SCWH03_41430 [Streptomyces pacificus]|uniref:Uncharacterized protein n=1 Tax=Streptomyces pacificus TaxID=2705029 RepID=A0A6A0AZN5_9ACTN|nr:hypothetical protein SCWH03_41430 [Streptomyces pacificus]
MLNEGAARATVRVGAEVQGMLDQSRADQVEATSLKTHEDYEEAVAERAGWVAFGATAGIAAGVAFLPATAAVGAARGARPAGGRHCQRCCRAGHQPGGRRSVGQRGG